MLDRLQHDNIVRLYETMRTSRLYCFVMEYVSGGDLCSLLKSQRGGRLTEQRARNYCTQLVSALIYMHSRGVIHRDLKVENIMLSSNKDTIKIVDFGLSNRWSDSQPLNTNCGSPEYAAPELFEPHRSYGPEIDVWSMGVVYYVMLVGRLPFMLYKKEGMSRSERKNILIEQISAGLADKHHRECKHLSSDCSRLLSGVLEPDVKRRLSVRQVSVHPWFGTEAVSTALTPPGPPDPKLHQFAVDKTSTLMSVTKEAVEDSLKKRAYDHIAGTYNILVSKDYDIVSQGFRQSASSRKTSYTQRTGGDAKVPASKEDRHRTNHRTMAEATDDRRYKKPAPPSSSREVDPRHRRVRGTRDHHPDDGDNEAVWVAARTSSSSVVQHIQRTSHSPREPPISGPRRHDPRTTDAGQKPPPPPSPPCRSFNRSEALSHRSSLTQQQSHRSSLTPQQSHRSSLTQQQSHRSSLTPQQSHRSSLTPQQSHRSSFTPQQSHRGSLTPQQSHRSSLTPQREYKRRILQKAVSPVDDDHWRLDLSKKSDDRVSYSGSRRPYRSRSREYVKLKPLTPSRTKSQTVTSESPETRISSRDKALMVERLPDRYAALPSKKGDARSIKSGASGEHEPHRSLRTDTKQMMDLTRNYSRPVRVAIRNRDALSRTLAPPSEQVRRADSDTSTPPRTTVQQQQDLIADKAGSRHHRSERGESSSKETALQAAQTIRRETRPIDVARSSSRRPQPSRRPGSPLTRIPQAASSFRSPPPSTSNRRKSSIITQTPPPVQTSAAHNTQRRSSYREPSPRRSASDSHPGDRGHHQRAHQKSTHRPHN